MSEKYVCPWGGGPTNFDYKLPFYDLVAEMTRTCVPFMMSRLKVKSEEIRDEVICKVILNFTSDLKHWRPFYDLYSFVSFMCNQYLYHELRKTNLYESRFKRFSDLPEFVDMMKRIPYKTCFKSERVDANKVGMFEFYLGEGCK